MVPVKWKLHLVTGNMGCRNQASAGDSVSIRHDALAGNATLSKTPSPAMRRCPRMPPELVRRQRTLTEFSCVRRKERFASWPRWTLPPVGHVRRLPSWLNDTTVVRGAVGRP